MPTVTMTSGMNVISRQNRTMAGTARNRCAKAIPVRAHLLRIRGAGSVYVDMGQSSLKRRLRTVVLGPPLFGT